MISLSDEDKIKYPDAEKFEEGIKAQLDKVPNAALIKDLMGKIDYTVGEPTYNGNEATIPVTISVPVMGQKIEQKVEQKMKNEGGIWKAVLTGMPGLGGNQGGFGGRGGFGGMGGPSMR
jgi:hypothetical protein